MQSDLSNSFVFGGVLFYGRSLSEYVEMFDLDLEKLKGLSILDCAAGPASFAAEAFDYGIEVTACDPRYNSPVDELGAVNLLHTLEANSRKSAVAHLFEEEKLKPNPQRQEDKEKSLLRFMADYEKSRGTERYVRALLPQLPFADRSFSLCLCSNFLFLYSDYLEGGMLENSPFDYEFHLRSLLEMLRVAQEVRLYPLKGPHCAEHRFLSLLKSDLFLRGYETELVPVKYRDIKDARQMLKIQAARL